MTEKRYSLWLINPKRKYRFNWDMLEVTAIMGKKTVGHPLALPLLAALTPDRYRVRIIDEEIESIPKEGRPDLVGITGMISNISRGYQLADHYRKLGIHVIMGGPQVTFDVDRALEHANTVLLGEAEDLWETFLKDFEKGETARTYRSEGNYHFRTSPIPRWDLLNTDTMLTFGVQVSRGCPYHCDFCLVRKLFGKKQRYRNIDNVIEEINALPPEAQIAFADDNLTANKTYTRELMLRLIPLKRSWSCQASLDITQDPELLTLMAKAGCNSILIGFETINPEGLREANKGHNRISLYRQGIQNVHNAGIHVLGSFVVGFESDKPNIFDKILKFTEKMNLSFVMLNALSVYPGTDLYERMRKQRRVTRIHTDLCNGLHPTMHYRHISQAQMFARILLTLDRIYSFKSLLRKAPLVLGNGAFINQTQPEVPKIAKFKTVLHLFFRWFLFAGWYKRKLLFKLISLVKEKKTDVGAMMQFLLFITSIRGYLAFNKKMAKTIIPELQANDEERRKRASESEKGLYY